MTSRRVGVRGLRLCCSLEKKDGGLRLVIYHHRRLNAATFPNRWPLPRIDDLFDKLGACSYLGSLDLLAGSINAGYAQRMRA